MGRVRSFFFVKDGTKEILNKKKILIILLPTFAVGLGIISIKKLNEDTSYTAHSDSRPIGQNDLQNNEGGGTVTSGKVTELLSNSSKNNPIGIPQKAQTPVVQLRYKAKQVIVRDEAFDPEKVVPIGTNIIGKLLNSIDTRDQGQLYKVLLPYGGKHKNGREIPKNTTVFGRISYPGKGKKVFLTFDKGLLPNGQEIKVAAQALNPKDYSPGITGDYHSKAGTRLATTLGLTMLSGATDVLTERQEVGIQGSVAMKASLKNALYQGVSQASALEANRQAGELNSEPEYVTVDAGSDLIVNLTGSFVHE